MERMTEKQLEIARHALGLDSDGRGNEYRNHFVTSAECDDGAICESLCSLGLMSRRNGSELTGGMPCYHVTQKGREAVRAVTPKPQKLRKSPAFQAWERYCDAFYNMPFSQFWKEVWPSYPWK